VTAEETLKKLVKLYFESKKADEHYEESWAAKAEACGLADDFHELMIKLRKDLRKGKKSNA
jgi:hypothetical protein